VANITQLSTVNRYGLREPAAGIVPSALMQLVDAGLRQVLGLH
jgi:hypothetical protein